MLPRTLRGYPLHQDIELYIKDGDISVLEPLMGGYPHQAKDDCWRCHLRKRLLEFKLGDVILT